jgi:hypothetical protein
MACSAGFDLRADIFGAGAGLAKAAPGEQQPDPPITGRRFLRVARLPFVFFFEGFT